MFMPTRFQRTDFRPSSSGYLLESLVRLFLCGLLVAIIPTGGDDPHLGYEFITRASWVVIFLYAGYSIGLFVIGRKDLPAWSLFRKHGVWLDLLFLGALSLSSGGIESPFNFLIVFIIIYVTSGHPFRTAIQVTVGTVALYSGISLATMNWNGSRVADQVVGILSTAVVLLLFGFIIAYRGGREYSIKRRLSLIQQIGAVATPQIGLTRSIGVSLSLLRDYFEADECILVMRDDETKETNFYKTHVGDGEGVEPSEMPDKSFIDRLLSIPPAVAVMFSERPHWRTRQQAVCVTLGFNEKFIATESDSNCQAVGEVLDATCYLSVPITIGRRPAGRIYIIRADRTSRFNGSDVDLVAQIANQLTPLIENARLIDAISSEAADDERKRIARDIHDSIIQPYMGIKFGLESIDALLGEGGTASQEKIRERIKSLGELSEITIENLRGMVQGLADTKSSGGTLLPSIRRFAEKFSGATGIDVEIETDGDMTSADRLASDLFQLAVEGLSNVRKHTASTKAILTLDAREDGINLKIVNDAVDYETFRPRSITERVAALRGTVDIRRENGNCVVDIDIPL